MNTTLGAAARSTAPCRFDIVEVVGEGDKMLINHLENAFEDE